MRFPGFSAEALTFFRGLKRNNNREWFQARKHIFEDKVKRPMLELVSVIFSEMMEFAPDYVSEPQKTVYRIYRDTRFSADKKPYKDHIAASFTRRGLQKHAAAGFYFSVSDSEIEVGGGVYMPGAEELLAIRNHIAGHHAEFRAVAAARDVRRLMGEVQGEQLSRVPKGFSAEHPAADVLRFKQFLFFKGMEPAVVTTPRLEPELVKRFRAMTPFVEFLNAPLVAGLAGRLDKTGVISH